MNTQNNIPLIVAGGVVIAAIAGVTTLLVLQPDNTNIALLLGFVGLAITNILANRQIQNTVEAKIVETAIEAKAQVREVHDSVNGKMQQLNDAIAVANFAKGKEAGVESEKKSQSDKTIAQDV